MHQRLRIQAGHLRSLCPNIVQNIPGMLHLGVTRIERGHLPLAPGRTIRIEALLSERLVNLLGSAGIDFQLLGGESSDFKVHPVVGKLQCVTGLLQTSRQLVLVNDVRTGAQSQKLIIGETAPLLGRLVIDGRHNDVVRVKLGLVVPIGFVLDAGVEKVTGQFGRGFPISGDPDHGRMCLQPLHGLLVGARMNVDYALIAANKRHNGYALGGRNGEIPAGSAVLVTCGLGKVLHFTGGGVS